MIIFASRLLLIISLIELVPLNGRATVQLRDKVEACGAVFSESDQSDKNSRLEKIYRELIGTVPTNIRLESLTQLQTPNALAAFHVPSRTLYLREINSSNLSASIAALAHELWHIQTSEKKDLAPQSELRLFMGELRPWNGSYPHGFSIDEWPAYLTELKAIVSYSELHGLLKSPRFKPSQYLAQIMSLVRRSKKSAEHFSEAATSDESKFLNPISVEFDKIRGVYQSKISPEVTLQWPSDLSQLDLRVNGYIYSIRTNSEEQKILNTLNEGKLKAQSKKQLRLLLKTFDKLVHNTNMRATELEQQLEQHRSKIVGVGSRTYEQMPVGEQRKVTLQLARTLEQLLTNLFVRPHAISQDKAK